MSATGKAQDMGQHSPLIEAALWWAEQGVPVFPCSADKRPLTANGFENATTDPKEVVEMFNAFGGRAHLIGGRMGREAGMFAIDVDLYKGAEPEAWLDDMLAKGLMGDTRIHRTARGGVHYLYESDVFPNVYPVDGVEVRGEGSYIIMSGSPGYTVFQDGIAWASPELIAACMKKKEQHSRETVGDLKQKILKAENFHDSLARLAARLSAQGMSAEKVQQELLDVLRASVASSPTHERHDRWLYLLNDQSEEFSRLVGTSDRKYNSRAASEAMDAEFAAVAERMRAVADKAGFFTPSGSEISYENVIPLKKPEDYTEWPFPGYWASNEPDLLEQTPIVENMIYDGETILVAAQPKAGKTILMLTVSLCVACGIDVSDRLKVYEPRTVLYFGLEGKRAIWLRTRAWKMHRAEGGFALPDNIPVQIVDMPVNLLNEHERKDIASRIIAANRMTEQEGLPPLGMVVIDTFTKAMLGGDQNKVEETGLVFDLVSQVRAGGCNTAIVFVHHLSKEGTYRGSSNIEAEPDTLFKMTKEGSVVKLHTDRARSMEEGAVDAFNTVDFPLGENKFGYKISAPVLLPLEELSSSASGANLAQAQLRSKVLSRLVGMAGGGEATLSLKSIQEELAVHGLAVMTETSRRGGKERIAAANTKAVQEFFEALISDDGCVFGGYAVSLVRKDGLITGVHIR